MAPRLNGKMPGWTNTRRGGPCHSPVVFSRTITAHTPRFPIARTPGYVC